MAARTSIGSRVGGKRIVKNIKFDDIIANGRWPIDTASGRLDGGWAYHMRLARQNGCWVVTQLRVFPCSDDLDLKRVEGDTADEASQSAGEAAPRRAQARSLQKQPVPVPPGGLTARHLRQIPFGKHTVMAGLNSLTAAANAIADVYRQRAIQAHGDVRLARIAHAYVKALSRGSLRPNEDVAAQLGIRKASQVRDAIHMARRKGLLSSTRKRGVPGGELTAKAIELLRAESPPASVRRPRGRVSSERRRTSAHR